MGSSHAGQENMSRERSVEGELVEVSTQFWLLVVVAPPALLLPLLLLLLLLLLPPTELVLPITQGVRSALGGVRVLTYLAAEG